MAKIREFAKINPRKVDCKNNTFMSVRQKGKKRG